ncbi:MAG: hypothetical protein CFH10_00576 [Alphaproteobacteria bacterium MarineAlpha4_Bin2]|nr:MAG: hypothetical protein CFH10_00576 [Alphaproteobacteria bacterium MarineAlpha4_Bin2]
MIKCLPQLRAERNLRQGILAYALVLAWVLVPAATHSADSAVFLMYHRFGEVGHPQTNITSEQFDRHLEELTNAKYTVLPVPEILAKLKLGAQLPERTIGITIDDAFRSVYEIAFPKLRDRKLPFTLFVATRAVDRKLPDFMTWDQIRELQDAGVTIGSQTHTHLHMAINKSADNRKDIETSNNRFASELGHTPTLFAYPYGEAGSSVMSVVKNLGFEFAFGQHSGVAHRTSPAYFLPRFAFNEAYSDVERFRLVANALPLPVSDIVPRDPLLKHNPPAFGFTVKNNIENLSRLSCYHSQQGKAYVEWLGSYRAEVRFKKPFKSGRSRLNCTLPGPENRWRWFGHQYYAR